MSYCASDDLLTGNIPVPGYIDPAKVVADAADEIDTYVGMRYVTPVVLTNNAENRPYILLLKRINSHLATGRLLMEAAAAQENTELHAYAKRLIDESLIALTSIQNGEIVLGDAVVLPSVEVQATGPIQYNKEITSMVDAFYDDIVWSPTHLYPAAIWPAV